MIDNMWKARTFWELVERRAEATPDAPMMFDEHDRRVTFGEFHARAERVAAAYHELGITTGSSVAWQLPTRIETVVASIALSRLGATQTPIIPLYRDREVGFVLRQTAAEFVLVPDTWRGHDYPAMIERLELERPPVVLRAYDSLPEGDPGMLPPPPAPPETPGDAPVRWIYYTSGTTSEPKGVQHTDATLLAGGMAMAKVLPMGEGDVGSIAFPYAHIAGPDYIVSMLVQGFPAVLLEAFVPADAVTMYNRYGVTMAGGSTAFYIALVNEQRKHPDRKLAPTLRVLSGGGAPKPPEIFYEVRNELGCVVQHGYAMTECPMGAFGRPEDSDEQLAFSEGRAVPGCEISIVRRDGSDADVGEEGEVRVGGTMLFKGYVDASLNAQAFDERGRYRTGDLGSLRPDGHLNISGRLKDVIIRKGENISAKEVEDVLYAHPKVGDVAVIGLPDRERGERVCAVVEPAPGAEPLGFDEMVVWCRDAGLMMQKIPEQLVVQSLPRNPTLKVLKYKLRAALSGTPI